ncbi:MAG: hypothetical protein RR310_06995 [Eubacterium sp.]
MIYCKVYLCGNFDDRFKNGCRALQWVLPPEQCFARMSKDQAKIVDEINTDALQLETINSNKRYYKKKKEQ